MRAKQKNVKRAEEKKNNNQPVVTTLVRKGRKRYTHQCTIHPDWCTRVGWTLIPSKNSPKIRDSLDAARVGELCHSSPASQAHQNYSISFNSLSLSLCVALSLSLLECGTLSTHPLVKNDLSLLAANSVSLNSALVS